MIRRLLALALCLVLAACATAPRERSGPAWSGRVGLQVQSDPPQSLQAGFELQGSATRGDLTLLGPLGGTLAHLHWTPGQALLERGGQRWQSTSVEALAEQLTQTPLPVQALFDWLEGRAVDHAGWQPDLGDWAQGRIQARRTQPPPAAQLRIVLDR